MAIYFAGGEAFDFPLGAPVATITSGGTGGTFRGAPYSRVGIRPTGTSSQSDKFNSSPLTEAWLSCWWGVGTWVSYINSPTTGFALYGTANYISVGMDGSRMALWKNGVKVQSEVGANSTPANNTGARITLHVVNCGSAAPTGYADVYVNGNRIIHYEGLSDISGVDQVIIHYDTDRVIFSELIVADEDTRDFALVTMYPNAAGSGTWTGAYTDIADTGTNDATVINTNAAAQDQQFPLYDGPTTPYSVKALSVVARATKTADSTPNTLALGFKEGSTVYPGTAQSLTTSFARYRQVYALNPADSQPWESSDLTDLQVNFESGA